MKYNVPYGMADETTLYGVPYINGNPTTGTMGSIPPAASIEYDQREIIAVIQWANDHGYHDYAGTLCAAPTNADLTQLLKAIFGIMNSTRLTAPQTYYVNATTGDDSFNGLTAGTPFKTLQRAANQATFFNLNGFSVTVNVADGTYAPVILPQVNGSGNIYFVGNQPLPVNCKIHANVGAAVTASGGPYVLQGFRLESDADDAAHSAPGSGVWSTPGGNIAVNNCEFGNCSNSHMYAQVGTIAYVGSIRICGNTNAHLQSSYGSWLYATGVPFPTLVIPAAQNISNFAYGWSAGTVTPRFSSITGSANVTGSKYGVTTNGIIDVGGAGVSYLPGSTAGVASTGGQYL